MPDTDVLIAANRRSLGLWRLQRRTKSLAETISEQVQAVDAPADLEEQERHHLEETPEMSWDGRAAVW